MQIKYNNRPEGEKVKINSQNLYNYIKENVQKYYGEFGVASLMKFHIIYFNERTRLFIIQVRHGPHRFVTSILPLLQKANETARYRTLYVGATLQQCQKFIIKHQQIFLHKFIGNCKGPYQMENFAEEVMKIQKI